MDLHIVCGIDLESVSTNWILQITFHSSSNPWDLNCNEDRSLKALKSRLQDESEKLYKSGSRLTCRPDHGVGRQDCAWPGC